MKMIVNCNSLKIGYPKRKCIFQPSIVRGYISFREGTRTFPQIENIFAYPIPWEGSSLFSLEKHRELPSDAGLPIQFP